MKVLKVSHGEQGWVTCFKDHFPSMQRLDVRSGGREQFDARAGLAERFKRLKRENF